MCERACVFFPRSNYADSSLQQPRTHGANPRSPNIHHRVAPPFIFLSLPSTLRQSVAKTISCSRLLAPRRPNPPHPPNPHYTHTNTRTQATNLQNNNSKPPPPRFPLHRSFLLRLPHSLSCNSILMGFIGSAIHLSAAAQFNYISEPAGLSPDNLQRSPPDTCA